MIRRRLGLGQLVCLYLCICVPAQFFGNGTNARQSDHSRRHEKGVPRKESPLVDGLYTRDISTG
jgi:hypothetical protein